MPSLRERMQWMYVDGPEPEWMRSAGRDPETGDIYIPAFLTYHECQMFLLAVKEMKPLVFYMQHPFVRVQDALQFFPDASGDLETIKSRATGFFKDNPVTAN